MLKIFITVILVFSSSSQANNSIQRSENLITGTHLNTMGDWQTKCHDYGDDSILISKLEIRGYKWSITHDAFEDDKCAKPWLQHKLSYKVNQQGHNLDMTLVSASYVALTSETVEALNLVSYCGFADWKVKVEKNVLGKECQDYKVPKQGQILYSTFLMSQVEAKPAVSLGVPSADLDGGSPATRFQKVSDVPFLKN